MFTREKKLIALLLTAALAFTMNTSMFAAVGAEATVESSAYTTTETSTGTQLASSSQTMKTVSANYNGKNGKYTVSVNYNTTPLFVGKKLDAAMLNVTIDVTPEGGKTVSGVKITKVKFQKGDAGKGKAVGDAQFAVTAFDKKAYKSDKDTKKMLADVIKSMKKDFSYKATVQKFSVSTNDIDATNEKKLTAMPKGMNYVVGITYNEKKELVKKVVIWCNTVKDKPKKYVVKKNNYTFTNGVLKFAGNFGDGEISIDKKGKPTISRNAVSGNGVSANTAK